MSLSPPTVKPTGQESGRIVRNVQTMIVSAVKIYKQCLQTASAHTPYRGFSPGPPTGGFPSPDPLGRSHPNENSWPRHCYLATDGSRGQGPQTSEEFCLFNCLQITDFKTNWPTPQVVKMQKSVQLQWRPLAPGLTLHPIWPPNS